MSTTAPPGVNFLAQPRIGRLAFLLLNLLMVGMAAVVGVSVPGSDTIALIAISPVLLGFGAAITSLRMRDTGMRWTMGLWLMLPRAGWMYAFYRINMYRGDFWPVATILLLVVDMLLVLTFMFWPGMLRPGMLRPGQARTNKAAPE
jgi:hypothetical protein